MFDMLEQNNKAINRLSWMVSLARLHEMAI